VAAQAAPFQYISDTGNGAGIAAALAAASAGPGGWVHIRRGLYDLGAAGAPALPLAVPGLRVTGDGCSTIIRMSTLDRRIFVLTNVPATAEGRVAELADFAVDFTTAVDGASGVTAIDAGAAIRARIENVEIIKSTAAAENPFESLTTIFLGGVGARFLNTSGINIDGNANLGVVGFRMTGTLAAISACIMAGTNVCYRFEGTLGSIATSGASGGAIFATATGMEVAAADVSIVGCQILSVEDGIVSLAGLGGATIQGNNLGGGMGGDGIRIEAGATNNIVLGNRLNGNSFSDFGTLTERAHNTP
jgi:hypothetical protein